MYHADVETFQAIDARLRKAFRWLEKAVTYLDELKPAIDHRFDLGHGLVFESPRFAHGSVGQHERRIVGFPVLDEINIYYEISPPNRSRSRSLPAASRLRKNRSTTPDSNTPAGASKMRPARCANARFRFRQRYRRRSRFAPTISQDWS